MVFSYFGTELDEVEPGVASNERVERPRDDGNALIHRPPALMQLDGGADVPIAVRVDRGGHVRVQVQLVADVLGVVTSDDRESRTHHDGAVIRRGDVTAGVLDGAHEVGEQLAAAVSAGPHEVEQLGHPAQVVEVMNRLDHHTGPLGRGFVRLPRRFYTFALHATHAIGTMLSMSGHPADLITPRTADLVDAVRRLVEVESPTSDVEACRAVAETTRGLIDEWLGGGARVTEHNGRPVVEWGAAEPRILLLGHIDTVWPLGTLERIPFSCIDDRLTGPGVFDMKAGVVQMIAAVSTLADRDGVGILLTTDEETGSLASRDVIAERVRDAEAVLVFEPSVDGAVKTARKGTSWYVQNLVGRAAHAGLDPERGVNSLVAASQFVLATTAWGAADAGTTVTPTMASAGTTSNTVPATASVTVDVRAWTRSEQERVDGLMRAWVPDLAGATAELAGGIDRPAMEAERSQRLFEIAQREYQQWMGAALEGRAVGGASDGNLTAAQGIDTLDGLGAIGDGAHAEHEWASVSGLVERSILAGLLIAALQAQT